MGGSLLSVWTGTFASVVAALLQGICDTIALQGGFNDDILCLCFIQKVRSTGMSVRRTVLAF